MQIINLSDQNRMKKLLAIDLYRQESILGTFFRVRFTEHINRTKSTSVCLWLSGVNHGGGQGGTVPSKVLSGGDSSVGCPPQSSSFGVTLLGLASWDLTKSISHIIILNQPLLSQLTNLLANFLTLQFPLCILTSG